MMKCPMCYSKLKKGKFKEEYLGHFLGEFDGFICTKCGEKVFSEESAKKAEQRVKELGLWGLSERTAIAKSGNSLSVRVKKKIADYLGLVAGKEVTIHPEGKNRLVVDLV